MTFQLILHGYSRFHFIAEPEFLRICIGWITIVFHARNIETIMCYQTDHIAVCMDLLHQVLGHPDPVVAMRTNSDIDVTPECVRYSHTKGDLVIPVTTTQQPDESKAA